ncbi:MAG: TetR/AcrR family transcriptional regulator [Solirubrobacterales bacterium]
MAFSAPPTPKGARQAQEILDAALRCLGRDGFSATSLSRVADEAGVSKRMVLYYFDSREALFDQLAESIGERLITALDDAIDGLEDPAEAVTAGFSELWTAITADRGLLVALFGVTTEAVTDARLDRTVSNFKDRFRDLLRKQLHLARANGRRITVDDDIAVTAVLAGFLGLSLEWLERGDTPELEKTIGAFQAMLTSLAPPA